jgi:hypothetical protein
MMNWRTKGISIIMTCMMLFSIQGVLHVPGVKANGIVPETNALISAMDLLEMDANGQFIHFPSNDFMFKNTNGGRHPELERALALAVLGHAIGEGNRSQAVVDAYIAVVEKVINDPNHMPDIDCGLDARQQNSFMAALAFVWNQPDIKASFSNDDKERIEAFAKAGVIACSYVYASYMGDGTSKASGQRISMDGDTNTYSSPNYAEAIMGMFLSSSMIYGFNNVAALLDNYDHSDFLEELDDLGLTDVYTTFAQTFLAQIGSITYDASDSTKKAALVESIVKGVSWNDGANRPFWSGLTLAQIIADPVRLYYDLVTSTYTEAATEGDYIGNIGRGHEFNTRDSGGTRDGLSYSAISLPNSYLSKSLLEHYGYWDASSLTDLKLEIENRMLVGSSDIQGKAHNGYWSLRRGAADYENLVEDTGWYFPYTEHLGKSLGMMKDMYVSENFEDGLSSVWTAVYGSWSVADEVTWSGSTNQLEKVLQTDSADTNGKLIASFEGSNFDYYVPLKINAWGSGGTNRVGMIGRYIDDNNYYLLCYSYDTSKLQIIRVSGGVSHVLAEKLYPMATGKVYHMKGAFAGSTLKLYVNGVLQAQAADATHSTGYIGLLSSGAVAKFDDIYVTEAGSMKPMPPRVPMNLKADVASDSIHLTWDSDPDVVEYSVRRGIVSGGPYTEIGTTSSNEFYDEELVESVNYYYVITAANTLGESGPSNEATVSLQFSLSPIADAMVRGGSSASSNYGSTKNLDVKASLSLNYYRESYMKFDLSSLTDTEVGSALLKLYVNSSDPMVSPVSISVYAVLDDQWTEGGITYGNKPTAYQLLDTTVFASNGEYMVWDVTDFVLAQANDDQTATFVFMDNTYSDKSVSFKSRESAANTPMLEINLVSTGSEE